jgi:hypothetical protein
MNEETNGLKAASGEVIVEPINSVKSAFCGSLRSKKYFMRDTLATAESDYLDASNHCWCCETQQVIGPDGNRVHPNRCGPDRSCYVSALG